MSGSHFFWPDDPNLFTITIGSTELPLRFYGLMFMTAFLFGFRIMNSIFKGENKDTKHLDSLLNYMLIGTIVGARLGHCFFYEPDVFLANPIEILKVWKGGLASHGGLAGILFALFLYARKQPDISYIWLVDRMSIPSLFGAFLIRMGNFFNSEIVGHPTLHPFGIVFERYIPNFGYTPLHPSMLYEAFSYLVFFILLVVVYRHYKEKCPNGLLTGLLLSTVFIARIIIEFTKQKQEDFALEHPINMGQYLSVPFILIGFWLIFQAFRKNKVSETLIKEEIKD